MRGRTGDVVRAEIPPGKQEATSPGDDAERREREQVSLYEAVASSSGARPTGRWARFDLPGWFSVGITQLECLTCRTDMEGYRKPYVTSAGARYHYWALVCVACCRPGRRRTSTTGAAASCTRPLSMARVPAHDRGGVADRKGIASSIDHLDVGRARIRARIPVIHQGSRWTEWTGRLTSAQVSDLQRSR